MPYTKQFLEDVTSILPERFHKFFEIYQYKLPIEEFELIDFVKTTLEEKFEEKATKEELAPVIRRLKKASYSKRHYLGKCFFECASLDISNKKHPLNFITTFPTSDYYNKFGNSTHTEVVESYNEKVKEWQNCLSSGKSKDIVSDKLLLIDFPVPDFIKPSVLLDCFKIDISLIIWDFIDKELGGNISAYNFSTLQRFIGKPLWSSGRFTKKLDKIGATLYKAAIWDKNGQLLLTFQSEKKLKPILAEDGRVVTNYLINILDNISELSDDREYEIPLRSIANQIASYNANSQVLARTRNVLHYLANITYVFNNADSRNDMIFHILNAVTFLETGAKEIVRLKISREFQNEVISGRIVSVKAKEYHLLETNLSRAIVHALKREQYLHVNSVGEPFKYTYMFFLCNVYFESGSKKKNLQLIANSLKEFKEKQIIVDDFTLKHDVFYIKFLAL